MRTRIRISLRVLLPRPAVGLVAVGAVAVADRASLDTWASWLDELDIEHSGVVEADNPMPYSVVVFRDPDNIQLELFHMAT
jgi:hypothetical protein